MATCSSGGNMVLTTSGQAAGRHGRSRQITGRWPAHPRPVRHVINTHWHFDQTDGNEWLHATGAAILAHANTRKHLVASTRVDAWNFTFPPAPAGALPAIDFQADASLHLDGDDLAVEYYGPSHTDGDLSVRFNSADVFHTGDTWWNGHYPFIDYSTGGSIDGMIRATESNLARVGAKTIIIPGHGPVGDQARLGEFRDLLVAIREKVAALKKQGQSWQGRRRQPTAADGDVRQWRVLHTKLVYAGVDGLGADTDFSPKSRAGWTSSCGF